MAIAHPTSQALAELLKQAENALSILEYIRHRDPDDDAFGEDDIESLRDAITMCHVPKWLVPPQQV